MVADIYADAESLKKLLEVQGLAEWARRVEDIVAGGSTGTEILMGLRWVTKQILALGLKDEATNRLAQEVNIAADQLLR